MLIQEVAGNEKYYHEVLAAQLPAGLTDDNDIVGKAFVIAGMKLGMVKADRLFRETPIEQDIVTAYRQLHDLNETVVEDDLAAAQEIGAQLQTAMEDLYYAHRMGSPNPTVKQNINMLQKSVRALNQELNAMGYKYAPTVPGLVARMGTRFVEDELSEFAPPGGDDREPDEHEILRQLAAQWYHGDEDPQAEKTLAAMGWEIGHVESEQGGVFVIRPGDEHGDTYQSFAIADLDINEGFRVSAPQIRGTQNRAQSAYYPTNVQPKVPRLDKPLSDQELVRLTQLAGIKNNK